MNTDHDTVVIGGGLFGQIIARALRADGQDVLVIDNSEKLAGSGPAACLMKPSWFSSMGKDKHEPSLQLLDELFGVTDITFATKPKFVSTTVHWCNPADILSGPRMVAEVSKVKTGSVHFKGGHVITCRNVVVAAGIWTGKLLPEVQQVGQQGAAFLFPGASKLVDPFIQPWAPYRQLVAFDRADGLWVGDGTAIKMENWNEERQAVSEERCRDAVGLPTRAAETLVGVRPYAKGHKPCYLEEVRPSIWAATGGAKNGTISAGWCAHVIRKATT